MKNPTCNVRRILSMIGFLLFSLPLYAQSQLPECEAAVPFFNLDLSGSPDTSFTTPKVERQGSCCGSTTSDLFLSFYVQLHPQVAMVEIVVAPGYADPGGSGAYHIYSGGDLSTSGDCGPLIPGGQPVCITGSGPYKITYSKPGKNNIKYIFRQIPRPIFPEDDTTRVGCSLPLNIYGLDNISMTSINSSAGITTRGYYNSLLSCVNCDQPDFTPGLATPAWIDYEICGTPQASICGYTQSCDTVRIYTRSSLSSSALPIPASFCSNESGVQLVGSSTGGDQNYTYLWKNSSGDTLATNDSLWVSTAGTYTLEAGDGLSSATCPNEFISVPVTVGALPTVNAGSDQTVCASDPTVFLNGSSSTSSGTWSGGAGTYSPSNTLTTAYQPTPYEIASGSITLYLTATNVDAGCEGVTDSLTIDFSPLVNIAPSAAAIACHDGQTTINANASGGTAPYTYFWNTGSVNSTITATAGTYTVTAYDQFGCNATSSYYVANPTPLNLNISSTNTSTDISCDGSAAVIASGGTNTFTYLWSTAETTPSTAANLCYGIYTVTVQDGNNCSIPGSVVVNKPSCSSFNASITHTDVTCFGGETGTALASATGGTAPYSYSWNTLPVETTASVSGLSAGNYTVIVTDDLGCADAASVTIAQPMILTNSMSFINVSSIGGTDGSATANPSGGTPGYTYLWEPGSQTTQTATNLSSTTGGITYHVSITDANGCQIEDSVIINEPPCNNFYLGVNLTHVSCSGLSNGSAQLVIVDGTAPYAVVWSNGSTSGTSISGLTAGNYSVSVTDASNCTAIKTFTIGQPDPLSLALVPTNVTCHNVGDGTIDLTVAGGTFPYSYSWYSGITPIADHEDLIDLSPGTYSVTIHDALGCSITSSTGITQPTALTSGASQSDVTCYGTATGSINATVSGGVTPYSYSWSGPASYSSSVEDPSALYYGLYHLNAQDANGCHVGPLDVFINQPSLLSVSAVQSLPVSCNGGHDGAINTTSSGGTTPFTYAWSGPSGYSSTTEDPSGLYAGSYSVTVTDAQLCTATTSLSVTTTLDILAPVIHCHGDTTVKTSSSTCQYTQSGTALNATATDECQLNSLDYSLSGATTGSGNTLNGISFNKGITVVTWTATDASGNTATCSFNVTVNDSTLPSIVSCGISGSVTVNTDAGYCSYTHHGSTWIPTVSDNCGGTLSLTYLISGATSGSGSSSLNNVEFNYGSSTVVWTVTDVSGNTSTCSFNVLVEDHQSPLFTSCGPVADTTVSTEAGLCTFTVRNNNWNAAALDLCTNTSMTYALSGATTSSGTNLNGMTFQKGTTLVTWTATDEDGNSATCSFNVTVEDNDQPQVNCVADQEVNVDAGQCNYTKTGAAWNAITTDNCSVSTVLATLSGATTASGLTTLANVDFNLGTTTVLWTVTDGSGNTSTCSFDVTVNDHLLPGFSSCGASGNQTVNTDAGQCTYTKTGSGWDATATDNCTVSSVLATLSGATTASGLTTLVNVDFNLGTTTVLWAVTDGTGNTSTCSFNVVVSDNILPAISSCGAGGNQSVNVDPGQCHYTKTGNGWNATATDNCTLSSVLATLSGATTASGLTTLANVDFNLGTTTVLWTVTDGSGNISTCSFNVVVSDNILPAISSCGASGNQSVNVDPGQCHYTKTGAGWNATATDNCTVSSVLATLSGATTASGLTTLANVDFNLGTTTVLWTVTDGSGNTSTCSFNVVVSDNILPAISSCGASGSQSVNVDPGQCHYTMTGAGWNASATDNCTVSSVLATLSGATTASGLTTLANVDFNLGTTTVLWTVTDGSGNTSTCSFDVVVSDNILPTISSCGASGNQTVNTDAGQCNYTKTGSGWDAIGTDNCSVSTVIATLTGASSASGLTTLANVDFNLGTTHVLWTVTDGTGNTSTCSFDVNVNDNQSPNFISCGLGSDPVVYADLDQCTYTNHNDLWNAQVTDLCSTTTLSYSLSGTTTGTGTSLNGQVFQKGATVVTWTATDSYGNTATCSFTVTVEDNQLPSFLSCGPGSAISVPSQSGVCTYTQTSSAWNATAEDNCGIVTLHYDLSGATSGTGTTLVGQTFEHGFTTVTWTATDASGNTTTCSFEVTVTDVQLPVITSCGTNGPQTVPADAGECTYLHTTDLWNAAGTDNCGAVTLLYSLSGATSGTGSTLNNVLFQPGNTVVTWTATDSNGNSSTCSFSVQVIDTQNPEIISCSGSSTLVYSTDTGSCVHTVSDNQLDPVVSDNCSESSVIATLSGATTGTHTTLSGVALATGSTHVVWTVTDASGNTTSCSFDITVQDTELPELLNCPANIVLNTSAGQCGRVISWTPPTAQDNCQVSLTSNLQPGSFFGTGTTVITYTATDNAGNQSICSFTITVMDQEAPQMICVNDISSCDPHITYATPTATDNCGIQSFVLKYGPPSGSIFPVGTTVVTYEATDIYGNVSLCSFQVVIHPTPSAFITPTDISCHGHNNGSADLTMIAGSAPYTFAWSNGASSEDLSGLSAGSYAVNITDTYGCTTTSQVTILEPIALALSATTQDVRCHDGADGEIDLSVSGGAGGYTYIWSDGQQTEDADSLSAGNYMVIVTDSKGCAASLSTSIYQPDTMLVQLNPLAATCLAPNGTIYSQINGGTPPYAYYWSNGQTGSTLSNVQSGSYTLTVTDANGCVVHLRQTVPSVNDMSVNAVIQNVSCYGSNNGTARIIAEQAQPPYTIDWSNGATGISTDSLSAGSYTAVFTDANGCQDTLSVTITQPDTLVANITTSNTTAGYAVSANGACDGWMEALAEGGTADYTYLWSNGMTESYLDGVCAGTYSLVITDANGCVASRTVVLSQPLVLEMPNGFSPNDDGDNDAFVVHGLDAYPDNELIIFNRWGNIVFQKEDYQNDWYGENSQSEPLPDATYFVILKVTIPSDGTVTLTGYVDLRRN